MNVVVTLEFRFARTPDGQVWTQTTFAHSFWIRYLGVFDAARVLARVSDVSSVPGDWKRADGEGVSFVALPYYVGPWRYALSMRQVNRTLRSAVAATDAVILRVPSQIANVLAPLLWKAGHPYGVEVVGDPSDVFAPGSFRHPLRPLFRWWFTRQLQQQSSRACAAAYVTQQALQRWYPAAQGALAMHYSSVELPDTAFVRGRRRDRRGARSLSIVAVGTLAQVYKAPDVLVDAVATCVQNGLDVSVVWVGDGKHRPELEARAAALGLGGRVRFVGKLPAGEAVRAQLDGADLFVLPSRSEGLPRAMIEAMARGLPCIGSTVGGFPELLPPEDLVPPGDAVALAHKICEVAGDPDRMARMSIRNLAKAKEYRDEALKEKRISFYGHVRERTEEWQKEVGAT